MVVELVEAAVILLLVLLTLGAFLVLVFVQIDRIVHIHHRSRDRVVLDDDRRSARSWAVHYFPCGDLVQRQLDRLIGKLLARFLCLVSDIASALRREVDQQIAVAHTFHQFLHRRFQHCNPFSLYYPLYYLCS